MIIVFIFSAQSGGVSNAVSNSFAHAVRIERIAPLFNKPSTRVWELKRVLRKYAHVLLFALMGFFCALSRNPERGLVRRMIFAVSVCYLYACFDELHQTLIPGRTGRFSDTFIDLLGIAIGVGLAFVSERRSNLARRKREKCNE